MTALNPLPVAIRDEPAHDQGEFYTTEIGSLVKLASIYLYTVHLVLSLFLVFVVNIDCMYHDYNHYIHLSI